MKYELTPERLRSKIKMISGRDISSEQAGKFLDIFEGDINTAVQKAVNEFIVKHFGKKGSSNDLLVRLADPHLGVV